MYGTEQREKMIVNTANIYNKNMTLRYSGQQQLIVDDQ